MAITRINLIFTPYLAPTCVPIGIASLKSYVEENMDDVTVKTIDLNVDFINEIVEGRLKKLCDICRLKDTEKGLFRDEISQEQRELFKMAKDLIKDKKSFYNKRLFVERVQPLYDFVNNYSLCFYLILKDFLEDRIPDEDYIFELIKSEVEKAVEGNPKLIGFSVLMDKQIYFSLAMAKMIKRRYNIPIVFGGPAVFNFDLESLMKSFEFIDFIIVKEGEEALLELIKNLGDEENHRNVPNLVWRKNEEIVFNKEKIIDNLDELPTPDFSDLKLNEYYFPELILPLSSSRSCPWMRCKFCSLNIQYGGKYRQRSIRRVIEDIRMLKEKYGASNFFFTDSEITATRLKEIGQAISNAGLQVYFGCYSRPTKDFNIDVLKAAYEGGCRLLHLGVESLSDRYLEFVNKGTTFESILNVLENTSKLKIEILCNMLGGIPTQTKEELLTDMKGIAALQKKYDIFSVIYSLYNLGEHQEFYIERKKYGIEVIRRIPAFKKAYLNVWLEYRYADRSSYDLLTTSDNPEINSVAEAEVLLTKKWTEFGINEKNYQFIFLINNFLFETYLLYSKNVSRPTGSLHNRMNSFLKRRFSTPANLNSGAS